MTIDRSNWMASPNNRWAFRHIDSVLQTVLVPPSDEPLVLDEDPINPSAISLVFQGGNEATLDALNDHLAIDSLIALQGTTVRLEQYASHVDPDDRHILFSVSKSITGLLAGALVTAGRLRLDAQVTEYVPEATSSGFAGARVQDLLDMTTGLDFVEDYRPEADFAIYGAAGGWGPGPPRVDLRTFLTQMRPAGGHGLRFDYLSPATDMLGWALERASDVSYPEALARYVWQPMGAHAGATVTVDQRGLARAAGGISATLRDMARVGRLLLDDRRGVLPIGFVDDLLAGSTAELWRVGSYADFFTSGAYRNGWYQPQVGCRQLCAIGIHGQYIHIDFDRDVVVAITSSRPTADDPVADYLVRALALAVGEVVAPRQS